ncbi:MAG: sigma-70 family RNA polymerase sigma factor, partial [Candidatus Omnitrophica bacterium]|nr:sigma-70 family RNA polymerase sigma factor [Candidatus Omnitrophota bacterium]
MRLHNVCKLYGDYATNSYADKVAEEIEVAKYHRQKRAEAVRRPAYVELAKKAEVLREEVELAPGLTGTTRITPTLYRVVATLLVVSVALLLSMASSSANIIPLIGATASKGEGDRIDGFVSIIEETGVRGLAAQFNIIDSIESHPDFRPEDWQAIAQRGSDCARIASYVQDEEEREEILNGWLLSLDDRDFINFLENSKITNWSMSHWTSNKKSMLKRWILLKLTIGEDPRIQKETKSTEDILRFSRLSADLEIDTIEVLLEIGTHEMCRSYSFDGQLREDIDRYVNQVLCGYHERIGAILAKLANPALSTPEEAVQNLEDIMTRVFSMARGGYPHLSDPERFSNEAVRNRQIHRWHEFLAGLILEVSSVTGQRALRLAAIDDRVEHLHDIFSNCSGKYSTRLITDMEGCQSAITVAESIPLSARLTLERYNGMYHIIYDGDKIGWAEMRITEEGNLIYSISFVPRLDRRFWPEHYRSVIRYFWQFLEEGGYFETMLPAEHQDVIFYYHLQRRGVVGKIQARFEGDDEWFWEEGAAEEVTREDALKLIGVIKDEVDADSRDVTPTGIYLRARKVSPPAQQKAHGFEAGRILPLLAVVVTAGLIVAGTMLGAGYFPMASGAAMMGSLQFREVDTRRMRRGDMLILAVDGDEAEFELLEDPHKKHVIHIMTKARRCDTGELVELKFESDENEISIIESISHPYIVKGYGARDANGRFVLVAGYIDMPHVEKVKGEREGYDFDDYIADLRRRHLSSAEFLNKALGMMIKICDAYSYMHTGSARSGHIVTHGEAKAHHILVDKAGEPHVIDFHMGERSYQRSAEASIACLYDIDCLCSAFATAIPDGVLADYPKAGDVFEMMMERKSKRYNSAAALRSELEDMQDKLAEAAGLKTKITEEDLGEIRAGLEEVLEGTVPGRIGHTRAMMAAFDHFKDGDFDYFVDTIRDEYKVPALGYDRDRYIGLLTSLRGVYLNLSPRERTEFELGLMFHDVGYRPGVRLREHEALSAELAEEFLIRKGYAGHLARRVADVARYHAYLADVGMYLRPEDFLSLSGRIKKEVLLICAFDRIKYDSRNAEGDNRLLPPVLAYYLNLARPDGMLPIMTPGGFRRERFRNLLSPIGFLNFGGARGVRYARLEDGECRQLEEEWTAAAGEETGPLNRAWDKDINLMQMTLVDALCEDQQGFGRFTKIAKFFGQLTCAYEAGHGRAPPISIDTDVDFDTLPRNDSHYVQTIPRLRLLLDAIPPDATIADLTAELQQNRWRSAYGIPLQFEDGKITIRLKALVSPKPRKIIRTVMLTTIAASLAAVLIYFGVMTFGWFFAGSTNQRGPAAGDNKKIGIYKHKFFGEEMPMEIWHDRRAAGKERILFVPEGAAEEDYAGFVYGIYATGDGEGASESGEFIFRGMYVRDEYKRKGIGDALVALFFDRFPQVRRTYQISDPRIALMLQKFGFEPVERREELRVEMSYGSLNHLVAPVYFPNDDTRGRFVASSIETSTNFDILQFPPEESRTTYIFTEYVLPDENLFVREDTSSIALTGEVGWEDPGDEDPEDPRDDPGRAIPGVGMVLLFAIALGVVMGGLFIAPILSVAPQSSSKGSKGLPRRGILQILAAVFITVFAFIGCGTTGREPYDWGIEGAKTEIFGDTFEEKVDGLIKDLRYPIPSGGMYQLLSPYALLESIGDDRWVEFLFNNRDMDVEVADRLVGSLIWRTRSMSAITRGNALFALNMVLTTQRPSMKMRKKATRILIDLIDDRNPGVRFLAAWTLDVALVDVIKADKASPEERQTFVTEGKINPALYKIYYGHLSRRRKRLPMLPEALDEIHDHSPCKQILARPIPLDHEDPVWLLNSALPERYEVAIAYFEETPNPKPVHFVIDRTISPFAIYSHDGKDTRGPILASSDSKEELVDELKRMGLVGGSGVIVLTRGDRYGAHSFSAISAANACIHTHPRIPEHINKGIPPSEADKKAFLGVVIKIVPMLLITLALGVVMGGGFAAPMLSVAAQGERKSVDVGPILQPYLDRSRLLTAAEERDLLERTKAGDGEARDELVLANQLLVCKFAIYYHVQSGVPIGDLMDEGNVGLLTAIDKFDLERKTRLSTYASHCIKQAIKRAIKKQGRMVRAPYDQTNPKKFLMSAIDSFKERKGRAPSDPELAKEVAISLSQLKRLRSAALADEDAVSMNLGDDAPDFDLPADIPDVAEEALGEMTIEDALAILSERERKMVALRFGIDPRGPWTFQQISDIFPVTRERVEQIVSRAIAKMQRAMGITDSHLIRRWFGKDEGGIKRSALFAIAASVMIAAGAALAVQCLFGAGMPFIGAAAQKEEGAQSEGILFARAAHKAVSEVYEFAPGNFRAFLLSRKFLIRESIYENDVLVGWKTLQNYLEGASGDKRPEPVELGDGYSCEMIRYYDDMAALTNNAPELVLLFWKHGRPHSTIRIDSYLGVTDSRTLHIENVKVYDEFRGEGAVDVLTDTSIQIAKNCGAALVTATAVNPLGLISLIKKGFLPITTTDRILFDQYKDVMDRAPKGDRAARQQFYRDHLPQQDSLKMCVTLDLSKGERDDSGEGVKDKGSGPKRIIPGVGMGLLFVFALGVLMGNMAMPFIGAAVQRKDRDPAMPDGVAEELLGFTTFATNVPPELQAGVEELIGENVVIQKQLVDGRLSEDRRLYIGHTEGAARVLTMADMDDGRWARIFDGAPPARPEDGYVMLLREPKECRKPSFREIMFHEMGHIGSYGSGHLEQGYGTILVEEVESWSASDDLYRLASRLKQALDDYAALSYQLDRGYLAAAHPYALRASSPGNDEEYKFPSQSEGSRRIALLWYARDYIRSVLPYENSEDYRGLAKILRERLDGYYGALTSRERGWAYDVLIRALDETKHPTIFTENRWTDPAVFKEIVEIFYTKLFEEDLPGTPQPKKDSLDQLSIRQAQLLGGMMMNNPIVSWGSVIGMGAFLALCRSMVAPYDLASLLLSIVLSAGLIYIVRVLDIQRWRRERSYQRWRDRYSDYAKIRTEGMAMKDILGYFESGDPLQNTFLLDYDQDPAAAVDELLEQLDEVKPTYEISIVSQYIPALDRQFTFVRVGNGGETYKPDSDFVKKVKADYGIGDSFEFFKDNHTYIHTHTIPKLQLAYPALILSLLLLSGVGYFGLTPILFVWAAMVTSIGVTALTYLRLVSYPSDHDREQGKVNVRDYVLAHGYPSGFELRRYKGDEIGDVVTGTALNEELARVISKPAEGIAYDTEESPKKLKIGPKDIEKMVNRYDRVLSIAKVVFVVSLVCVTVAIVWIYSSFALDLISRIRGIDVASAAIGAPFYASGAIFKKKQEPEETMVPTSESRDDRLRQAVRSATLRGVKEEDRDLIVDEILLAKETYVPHLSLEDMKFLAGRCIVGNLRERITQFAFNFNHLYIRRPSRPIDRTAVPLGMVLTRIVLRVVALAFAIFLLYIPGMDTALRWGLFAFSIVHVVIFEIADIGLGGGTNYARGIVYSRPSTTIFRYELAHLLRDFGYIKRDTFLKEAALRDDSVVEDIKDRRLMRFHTYYSMARKKNDAIAPTIHEEIDRIHAASTRGNGYAGLRELYGVCAREANPYDETERGISPYIFLRVAERIFPENHQDFIYLLTRGISFDDAMALTGFFGDVRFLVESRDYRSLTDFWGANLITQQEFAALTANIDEEQMEMVLERLD